MKGAAVPLAPFTKPLYKPISILIMIQALTAKLRRVGGPTIVDTLVDIL